MPFSFSLSLAGRVFPYLCMDRPKIKRKREKDIVKVWLSTAIFFHNLFRGSFISRVISLLNLPGLLKNQLMEEINERLWRWLDRELMSLIYWLGHQGK